MKEYVPFVYKNKTIEIKDPVQSEVLIPKHWFFTKKDDRHLGGEILSFRRRTNSGGDVFYDTQDK